MRKWLESQLNVIPYGLYELVHGVHGVQVYSIWINRTVKISNMCSYFIILCRLSIILTTFKDMNSDPIAKQT